MIKLAPREEEKKEREIERDEKRSYTSRPQ